MPNHAAKLASAKELGSFYTPPLLSTFLAEWAVRSADEYVLEPGFGGCCFLEAVATRLKELGSVKPQLQIYGCDIDENAFKILYAKIGSVSIKGRYLRKDFLTVAPSEFKVPLFDTIIGNPPYVSNHNANLAQRAVTHCYPEAEGIRLSRKASLWAYFILHAIRFLKDGGKMAWVLPGSFLFADYAEPLRRLISLQFHRSAAFFLQTRIFTPAGTEESTVVLLAEGWKRKPKEAGLKYFEVFSLKDLERSIPNWQSGLLQSAKVERRLALTFMPAPAKTYFKQLAGYNSIKFGDLADIKIGIVTGANRFFIRDPLTFKRYGVSELMVPVLSKFCEVGGLSVTKDDFEKLRENNRPSFMLCVDDLGGLGSPLRNYLSQFPEEKREKCITFKKRKHWYDPCDGQVPDAFFPYMHHKGPRLVLNSCQVYSTNSIHRVFFNPTVSDLQKKLICISLLTSFSQLSAEIEGRSYGSGVLKHEPSEVRRIRLLFPAGMKDEIVTDTFEHLDGLLRKGKYTQAAEVADDLILPPYEVEHALPYRSIFNEALKLARDRRSPNREATNE